MCCAYSLTLTSRWSLVDAAPVSSPGNVDQQCNSQPTGVPRPVAEQCGMPVVRKWWRATMAAADSRLSSTPPFSVSLSFSPSLLPVFPPAFFIFGCCSEINRKAAESELEQKWNEGGPNSPISLSNGQTNKEDEKDEEDEKEEEVESKRARISRSKRPHGK